MKGYLQQYGIDFDQTFIAIVKFIAFGVFFAIVAFFDLNIDQIDVKTVFLYGFINQLIYIEILKSIKTKANRNMVYKLLKVFYNLKQSLRFWYKRFVDFFLK